MIEAKTKEKYKNHGLHNAEKRAAKEAAAAEAKHESSDVDLLADSLKSAERIRDGRLTEAMALAKSIAEERFF